MTDAEFPVTVKHQQHRHKLRKAWRAKLSALPC
jgi:hypothetical protein